MDHCAGRLAPIVFLLGIIWVPALSQAQGSLQATGAASPSAVAAGQTTLLTVAVTPAGEPPSTGITVFGDLSSIGGSLQQLFFDDGMNGDATAADGIFSFVSVIAAYTNPGMKALPITIQDAQTRTAMTSILLAVLAPPEPVDCVVASVGFGACSVPCGGGTQTELLTVVIPAANGGAACREPITQACNTQGCPVDCVVSDWSPFGACSATACGTTGTQTRTRTILTAPANGGAACPSLTDSQPCSAPACPPVEPCPCAGPWKNHGHYVSCVAGTGGNVSAAAKSSCGKK